MARRFGTEKVSKSLATVTTVDPTKTDIVAADPDAIFGLKGLIATNLGATSVVFNLCEGDDPVAPPVVLPASGTWSWDTPAGLELAPGSGLTASLGSAGSVDVMAYYTAYDNSTPITKEQARAATYIPSNATATRTPDFFGGQAVQ